MRLINPLFLLIFILGCNSPTNVNGVWVSKDYGILKLDGDNSYFLRLNCVQPIHFDFEDHFFEFSDVASQACIKREKHSIKNILVKVQIIDESHIVLTPDSKCFAPNPFSNSYLFTRLDTMNKYFDYDELRVLDQDGGIVKSYTKMQLNILDQWLDFEVASQLWFIFESGFDLNNEKSRNSEPIILELKKGNYSNTKTIQSFPIPCYINGLIEYLNHEKM